MGAARSYPPRYPDGKKIRLYRAIGDRVREMAKRQDLTLAELARRIGMSSDALRHISEGMSCPAHVLVAIAEELDCTVDDLIPVLTEDAP
jgi:DNA-binding Xre family transcriptional regulator